MASVMAFYLRYCALRALPDPKSHIGYNESPHQIELSEDELVTEKFEKNDRLQNHAYVAWRFTFLFMGGDAAARLQGLQDDLNPKGHECACLSFSWGSQLWRNYRVPTDTGCRRYDCCVPCRMTHRTIALEIFTVGCVLVLHRLLQSQNWEPEQLENESRQRSGTERPALKGRAAIEDEAMEEARPVRRRYCYML
ncbi:hypothetical protein EJ05DRAFT_535887 [Pseudovirgaria hyperparasitica]|uniref:Uncharacterized protein n=1 Tax=Pseudovirgaria hyperparasitica TaxID=470096 RepID=A0A6A6WER1_9PEZI|nr:uncharacterized protein EJ05DRAFT_535887 [Pseudovirgaria hyperparasitica]KAF2761025.1 hypothetical protein EJ05DRAFT_535887 [Pseudovirgaria hyperparasitica]